MMKKDVRRRKASDYCGKFPSITAAGVAPKDETPSF